MELPSPAWSIASLPCLVPSNAQDFADSRPPEGVDSAFNVWSLHAHQEPRKLFADARRAGPVHDGIVKRSRGTCPRTSDGRSWANNVFSPVDDYHQALHREQVVDLY